MEVSIWDQKREQVNVGAGQKQGSGHQDAQSWVGYSTFCSLPRESTKPKLYPVVEIKLSIEEAKPGGKELGLWQSQKG